MTTNNESRSSSTQPTGALTLPFVMRTNVLPNLAATVVIGPVAFFFGLTITGASITSSALFTFGLVMIVLIAFVMTSTKRFIIEPNQVKMMGAFGMTVRKIPIDGVGDLVIDGKKLKRRSDGKAIAVLGSFGANADDLAAIKAGIPSV